MTANFQSDRVRTEYERWDAQIEEDPYRGPTTLGIRDVLRAHFLIADFFDEEGEGMGGIGPMSLGALHSTLHRQQPHADKLFANRSRFDVCATLFFGILKNHCFYDANKRTGLLSLLYHLEKFGYCPTVSQKEIEDFAVDVAAGDLGGYSRYKSIAKSADFDPNVAFVSDYLFRNTRKIDNAKYVITYRELATILRRHGFHLEQPSGNTLEIVEYREVRSMFGLRTRTDRIRMGNIGFKSWSAQVNQTDLKKARRLTKLEYTDGVDAASFFGKLDPLKTLITSYQEPLRRLANR